MKSSILFIFLFIYCSLNSQSVSTFYQTAGIDDGLAIDNEGNVYGAQYTGSTVWKITPEGEKTAFLTGLDTPNGLAFDGQGYLHVVDNQGGAIHKVAPDGTASVHVPNIFSPSGIVKMPTSDTMIVSSWEGDKLSKVAPDGSVVDFVVGSGLEGPVGLVYDELDNLYVGNYNDRWIFKISELGAVDTITRLTVPGNNIGFITYRDQFIYATIPWDNKIYKVDLDGNYELYAGSTLGNTDGDISIAKFNGPNGILLSPDGEQLYISDFNTRSVRVISNLDGTTGVNDFLHTSTLLKSTLTPNIVSNQTSLRFELDSAQKVNIQVFDLNGQAIKTIARDRHFSAGENSVAIATQELAAGIYFVQLSTANGDEVVKKMIKGN